MTDEQTKLVEDNIGLVRFTINKYYPCLRMDEDIYQVGCVELIKAATAYKHFHYTFSTYAAVSIKNGICNHFEGLNRYKRQSNQFTQSLDKEIITTNGLTFKDVLATEDFSNNADLKMSLEKACEILTDVDKNILSMRLDGYTFDAIGKTLGMTKQNVQHRVNSKIRPVLKQLLEVAS